MQDKPHEEVNQETKFNAGVDIALDISRLFKQAEVYATQGEYGIWHLKLEAIDRKMSPKFRKVEEAKNEIDVINKEWEEPWEKFTRRYKRGSIIPRKLNDTIKLYLVTYEKALHFWRDKFGYGMPQKDDLTKAAWR